MIVRSQSMVSIISVSLRTISAWCKSIVTTSCQVGATVFIPTVYPFWWSKVFRTSKSNTAVVEVLSSLRNTFIQNSLVWCQTSIKFWVYWELRKFWQLRHWRLKLLELACRENTQLYGSCFSWLLLIWRLVRKALNRLDALISLRGNQILLPNE